VRGGRTYQLQQASALTASPWANVGTPLSATTNGVHIVEIQAESNAFFRAQVQRTPP
jgi:hypothetical protein